MVLSLEVFMAVLSRYITLKLLWRSWESDVKEGAPFPIFLQIFYKSFEILMLSYNLPHFALIFQKID